MTLVYRREMDDTARLRPARDTLRRALLGWYDVHRRTLPWRAEPGAAADPYRVWLSEIMLQQTTVAHATPYFLAFTDRWPTVAALAGAADAEVMSAWAGLGYYARARNLLACARVVTSKHAGRFPPAEPELRTLPGVGAYTAAAIAAIAFDQRANVVDGNVERVMARLFAVETPLPKAKPELERLAESLVAAERPGDWAQALMDLGATVCRPRAPLCLVCPLARECRARETGEPETYPRRAEKVARPHRFGVVYLARGGGKIAVVQRASGGLLGGMLGLPTSAWRDVAFTETEAMAAAPLAGAWRAAGAVEHVFTHFSLTLSVYAIEPPGLAEPLVWMTESDAADALPTVFRKVVVQGQAGPRSARTLARRVSIGDRPASVLKCQ